MKKRATLWYKHYPELWLWGTMGMSLEERGLYITLIDLMYSRGGSLTYDEQELKVRCGCGVRPLRRIINHLVRINKITRVEYDDRIVLTNARVDEQIDAMEDFINKKSRAGRKGGIASGRSRNQLNQQGNEANAPLESLSINGLDSEFPENLPEHENDSPEFGPKFSESLANLRETSNEDSTKIDGRVNGNQPLSEKSASPLIKKTGKQYLEVRLKPPKPPKGGSWDFFIESWPNKSDCHDGAKDLFRNLGRDEQRDALSAVYNYVQDCKTHQRKLCSAKRYITEKRWQGYAAARKPARKEGDVLMISAKDNPDSFQAWKAHYQKLSEKGDKEAQAILGIMKSREEFGKWIKVPSENPPK